MTRPQDVRDYSVLKLNRFNSESWAVISLPKGAIVLDEAGALIMGLDRQTAEDIAAALKRDAAAAVVVARPIKASV